MFCPVTVTHLGWAGGGQAEDNWGGAHDIVVNEGVCVCERVIEKSLIAIGMERVKASMIGKGGLDRIDS